MSQWYCKLDGANSGPFTVEELQFLISRGRLKADSQVRDGRRGKWREAGAVDGLFSGVAALGAATPAAMQQRAGGGLLSRSDIEPPPAEPEAEEEMVGDSNVLDESDGPPPPPASPYDPTKRNVALGVGGGVIVLLLLLLLMLLLWPSDGPSIAAGSGGGNSLGAGSGEGVASGDGSGEEAAADSEGGEESQAGEGGAAGAEDAKEQQASNDPGEADADKGEEAGEDQRQTERDKEKGDSKQNNQQDPNQDDRSDDDKEGEGRSKDEPDPEKPGGPFAIQKLEEADEEVKGGMFAGRTTEARKRLAKRAGGSAKSEAAVERGLKWLAKHQSDDGRWSLNQFAQTGDCNGQCAAGGNQSDTAGVSLGLLPFLGAGYTHREGKYKREVGKALDWLVDDQQESGAFKNIGIGRMYAHGMATIALCEALAMTGDKKLRQPAERAVAYILKAQHQGGGWRYSPGQAGDTSVVGWQVIALRSAQSAGVPVPKETWAGVRRYLDSAQADKPGGRYAYTPGSGPRLTMTAEGLLCRQYTGWPKTHDGLKNGISYLLENIPADGERNQQNNGGRGGRNVRQKRAFDLENMLRARGGHDFYYIYYATQVMHHRGGRPWKQWNGKMRDILVDTQEREGHLKGSWGIRGGHDTMGGRIYTTSLALLTLEVYYRHIPVYDLEDEKEDKDD